MYNEQTMVSLTFVANTKKKEKSYWLNQLSGQPQKSSFPVDYESKDSSAYRLETIDFSLPKGIARQLIDLSKGSNVHLFIFLLTGVFILLRKYSGNKDILLGIPVSRAEENTAIVNSALAIRCPFEDTLTFPQLLSKVQQILIEAGDHQNFPIQVLSDLLGMPWTPGEEFPLFDVVVSLANIHQDTLNEFFPNIMMSFKNSPTGLEGRCNYNPDRYDVGAITRLINHYQTLLGAVLANPYKKMSEIELLSEEEKHQILVSFNDTDVDVPEFIAVHELFDRQAEATPCAGAVVYKNQWFSYEELKKQTDYLAGILRQKGLQADQAAAVISGPCLEMVVSLIGILKAGGAYVPIDPEYPQDRIDYMLADSNARILIATEECRKEIIVNCQLLIVNCELLIGRPRRGLHHSNQLAYIIYTSGSTGKPKGVMIQHRSFVDFTLWAVEVFEHRPGYQVLLSNSFASDGAVQQIFPTLVSGSVLHLIDKELRLDIHHYLDYLKKNKINNIDEVPVLMNELLAQIDLDYGEEILPDLTCLCLGSEYVPMELVRKCKRYLNRSGRIINAYGPAEASVEATFYRFDGTSDSEISLIGKPRQNTRVYILDEAGNCCPIGVRGEIYISGMGLARGYLNQPELTAEKFILNRSNRSNRTYILYKTGDQGCWLPDGNIRFFGRVDNQIKIRGYRVELSEIEKVLKSHDGIKDAIVLVREKSDEEMEICAYYVEKPRGASNLTNDFQDNLRQYLEDRLPSYMMPAYYLALGKIPMTPNGKVDKNALPLPGQGLGLVGEYAPPRNDLEKKLVDIWSEVLKRSPETISININFFKIGGHSLKATILASRIYKEFNVKISLVEIFKNPTIKGLFTYINQAAGEMYFGIEAVEEREYYVLSSAQKRLYFLQQMDNSGTTYNIPSAWIIEGGIDKTNLELSMMKIIQRHESLRTSFELIEEEPVQRIHKSVEFEIEYDELAANNAKTHEEKIDAFIKHFTRPFDLSRSPLLRVGLAPLKEKSHLLMIDMHHIISDGVSTDILVREFTSLYLGGELPGINLQYKDYAEWQNREKMSEDHLKQCMYWKKEFTGEIPILDLPTDYERSAAQGYVGSRINFEICSDVAEALKSLSLETGTTLYMVLTAFYCIFLAKISGRDDIIIGSPVVGRRHADLEKIIGMFVNTLALRNYPSGEKKFCDFLAEVKEKVLLAFENQEYQYEDLVDELNVRRDAGRNPLFDTMFELQNIGRQIIDIPGLTFKPFTYENETAKFDLTLVAGENNGAIDFSLEYCTKLFKKETIERFIGYFKQIIISVIKKKDARIYDIEMVGEEEHKQLLTAIRNEENKILAGDMKAIQQIPAIVEGDFDF